MAHNRKNNRSQHIINENSPFAVAEAYKSVRTSILFANTTEGCNVIAITSSAAGEGKTVTCINVAISLAQSGKKVLLIDSDMRKPQIAPTLGLKSMPGLSELLSGVEELTEGGRCCRQKTEYEGLEAIAAGALPPNPAELIACPRTDKLLLALSKEYDYILIDTPPCMVVTDALLYKKHVMGYVAVVRANVSKIDATGKLLERFEQIGARVIGFILNGSSHKKKVYKQYKDYERHSKK